MKQLVLTPDQVVVPFEFLVGDERILRLYFRILKAGDYLELPSFPTDYADAGWIKGALRAIVTRLEEREEGSEVLTLEDRTRRLVEQRLVPDYMVKWYRTLRRGAGA